MPGLKISLSSTQIAQLEKRARASGFSDIQSYASNLLSQHLNAPEHLIVTSRHDLEAKLIEGDKSGRATEMTDQDWNDLRTEARRIASRKPRKAS